MEVIKIKMIWKLTLKISLVCFVLIDYHNG